MNSLYASIASVKQLVAAKKLEAVLSRLLYRCIAHEVLRRQELVDKSVSVSAS